MSKFAMGLLVFATGWFLGSLTPFTLRAPNVPVHPIVISSEMMYNPSAPIGWTFGMIMGGRHSYECHCQFPEFKDAPTQRMLLTINGVTDAQVYSYLGTVTVDSDNWFQVESQVNQVLSALYKPPEKGLNGHR